VETSKEKFRLTKSFEAIIIIKLLSADSVFTYWYQFLKPWYFSYPHHTYLFSLITKLRDTLEIFPTTQIVYATIKEDTISDNEKAAHISYLKKLKNKKCREADITYVIQKVGDFVKRQKYLLGIQKSLRLLENGSLSEVDKIFTDIVRTGSELSSDIGTYYFKDVKERVFRNTDHTKRYKFLIPELDERLRHEGLKLGETLMFLAPPGTGKTMALCHVAKAWVIQNLKGVYYTLQLPQSDISERLDASFSGVKIQDILIDSEKVVDRVQRAEKRYGNSLIIKYFPRRSATMVNIQRHLELLKQEDFVPKFIVIDFLNYLRPVRQTVKDAEGSEYFSSGDVAGEFISFCQVENILGATAIQANRSGAREDVVTLTHVAHSFEMAMEAQLVVSINRTSEERQDEEARLYMAKYSHGEDQYVLRIGTNYAKGSFYRHS